MISCSMISTPKSRLSLFLTWPQNDDSRNFEGPDPHPNPYPSPKPKRKPTPNPNTNTTKNIILISMGKDLESTPLIY